jgi:hypothetical protein
MNSTSVSFEIHRTQVHTQSYKMEVKSLGEKQLMNQVYFGCQIFNSRSVWSVSHNHKHCVFEL